MLTRTVLVSDFIYIGLTYSLRCCTLYLFHQPLPEKFVMKGMVERFNENFIETRRKALNRFLNRIADHPIFSSTEDFRIFLTADIGVRYKHT